MSAGRRKKTVKTRKTAAAKTRSKTKSNKASAAIKAKARQRTKPNAKPAVKGEAPSSGPLASRIVGAPVLLDAKAARARVDAWLDEDVTSAERKTLRALFDANKMLARLIDSLAESSPFLWELTRAAPERLLKLLNSDPDDAFPALLAATAKAAAASRDDESIMRLLRRMKAEAALMIALADIGGVWPVMRAAHALTELADAAVSSAVRYLLADVAQAGRLKLADQANPEAGTGYVVLAMGKMGAFELNYSSDIDLIVFYDPEAPALAPETEPGPMYVRMTQRLVKLLNERTIDGYVFRTDLRLRPDPSSTPIAISLPAALSYYESHGRNWERAAMIKARVCAGDAAAGATLLDALAPFVWRKYLDYAAVADVQAMKQQIHAYRGHGEIAVEGHNIKLGRGGIREVEFFAQTQQLVAGGRDPALRDRETLPTLAKLADGRWIDAAAREQMSEAYLFLRTVEHRLQMVNDEQTQTLPDAPEGMERFARFMGFAGRDAFARALVDHLENVQRQYGKLFETSPGAEKFMLDFPVDQDDRKTLDRLNELRFKSALEASATIRNWLSGGPPALRSEFARGEMRDLVPVLLEHLARAENPDAALVLFDRFLANLHGGSRLLSLLKQNPPLVALIAMILGTAPRLADTLARYPDVIDALVEPSFFGALPDEAALEARLKVSIAEARFDQDLLERIRMFGLEQMFLIGVRVLTGTVSAAQAGEAFARLADAVIRAVHRAATDTFAEAHGHMKREASAVLAMGKLGGNEMTAASDLDLIVVYDFDEKHSESDGPRKLHGAQYYARLTQRLINALTAQTNYGALYQVDLRLRPSGRSGPVATKLDSFDSYQHNDAWTWEHLALTRARVVSAAPAFAAQVKSVIDDVLRLPREAGQIAGDVVEMRGAIAAEKGEGDRWDLKYVRGGLVDIEFIAQYLQLAHAAALPDICDTNTARVLEKARRLGVLATEDAEVLLPAVRLYHNITQILRLCLAGAFDAKTAGADLLRLLARAADVPDFATLEATLSETQDKVRESFVRILGGEPQARPLGADV
ncbi:MAG: bifunctional [glutamine synthetase] adenylyltransferase/[glutamine synthetase]-adenylyl-L-tyrosine phosphorylase [Pseudolabrys sp.]